MASPDELWIVDFGDPFPGEPASHRPALVIGPPDTFGATFPFVVVCPLTTTQRGLSLHVEIEPQEPTGLTSVSFVQCELVRSINRRRLTHQIGRVDSSVSHQVRTVLATLLRLS